ncbi:hypothetical protein CC78DRAFT_579171 [Lojkania enalia]|uniref:Uncharacterized protein n=1 Tax=Lojkania enalia TaxID=147567 RepID=A0A9P4KBL8_9PLEO|nr:hypothetical protein CC78DRAFT_579171 [Didymosphaeria enalia]
MCLVKVRQEEDVRIPPRVVVRTRTPSPRRRASTHRISRTEVIRESRPPSASYVSVPAPRPLSVPAPQPVPVFIQEPAPPIPPPPPSHHSHHHTTAHYVEVSPRSSVTSHSPSRVASSDYVEREHVYRRERRDYSPDSPRYEHYRYVEPAPESDRYERFDRRRSRSRARSRGGSDYGHDGRGSYRETRERVVIVDDDGHRRREYRRAVRMCDGDLDVFPVAAFCGLMVDEAYGGMISAIMMCSFLYGSAQNRLFTYEVNWYLINTLLAQWTHAGLSPLQTGYPSPGRENDGHNGSRGIFIAVKRLVQYP